MTDQLIPNPWPGHCFGCSPHNPHGLQLRFFRTEGGAYTRCTIPEHLCGWDGIVHGGILATLLDEVGGWTLIAALGKLAVTAKFSIRYIKPVPTNVELLVKGEVLKHGRNFALIRSTIEDPEGTLLAEGESKWVIPRDDDLERITGMPTSRLQQFFDEIGQG